MTVRRSAIPVLLTIGMLACSSSAKSPTVSATTSNLEATASCDSTLAATGDDSDMRLTIQALADRCGTVRLGVGRFVIDGKLAWSRFAALELDGGKSIVGSGPATVLVFRGAGRTTSGGDYHAISIRGDHNLVADVTIDTSALVDTTEQTHAVHITGPARGNTIRGVWFLHPPRFDLAGVVFPGGDCIKITSYASAPSITTITGNHFVECDRSGIASVGGFESLIVANNTFHSTGDQDFDTEQPEQIGRNLVLDGNVHRVGKRSGGSYAIQVALREATNVSITNSILDGRGVNLYGVKTLVFDGVIVRQRQSGGPTLDITKTSDDLRITDSHIVREATALDNVVVKVQHHHTGMPGLVEISNTTIRNETKVATLVNVQSARGFKLHGDTLQWRPLEVPAGASHTLVAVATTAQRLELLAVSDTTFSGPAARAVQFNDKEFGIGAVTLTGNTSMVPISCQRVTTGAFGPLVSSGNNWPAPLGNCVFEAGK